jgi:ribosomal protein S17
VVREETRCVIPYAGLSRKVKIKAHDENNESHIGDKVKKMETRPFPGKLGE